MKNKTPVIVACAVVCVIGAILGIVLSITGSDENESGRGNGSGGNGNSTPVAEMTTDEAIAVLKKSASKVTITENHAEKGVVSYDSVSSKEELPDINTSYPLVVEPDGKEIVAEIFCSPEKAGSGTDGWLKELAVSFNDSNQTVNGHSAGIALRSISSGTQIDYIESGVYVPDAFTPSASMWADMLEFSGTELITISDRMSTLR